MTNEETLKELHRMGLHRVAEQLDRPPVVSKLVALEFERQLGQLGDRLVAEKDES